MTNRFDLAPRTTKLATAPARRVRSDFVPWLGLAALALLLALSAALAIHQRQEVVEGERQTATVLARVLEVQTSRHLDAAELMLATLGDRLRITAAAQADSYNPLLLESVRATPLLRSLSIVAADGRVVASSAAENRGARIDLDRVGRARHGDQARIGAWLPGRDLVPAALPNLPVPGQAPPAGASEPIYPGIGLTAMSRSFNSADGQMLYVVAALNTSYLGNQFEGMVSDSGARAYVLNFQGMVMAATGLPQVDLGDVVAMHPRLIELLPQQDQGSYIGPSVDGLDAIAAFRSVRKHPWVVVVERPATEMMKLWRRGVTGMLVVTVLLALLIAAATWYGWRVLRRQEQLEQELADAQQRLGEVDRSLRGVIEAAPAPMFVLDALGHYAMVNHAFEDFLGVHREQLIGAGQPLAPHIQQLAYHPIHDVPVWQGTGRSHYLDDLPSADGRLREALISKVAIPRDDGRPRSVIGSITDVTELREAERHMREAMQAAQSANGVKNEFIANMSHGLRTPLQSVLGFAELGSLRSLEHPVLTDMFQEIHEAGKRMLVLVNDLLDISRLESPLGTLRRAEVDALALTQEVVEEMRPSFEAKAVNLTLRSVSSRADGRAAHGSGRNGDDAKVWVDKDRLQQALRNVLDNARAFSPPDSTVEVCLDHPSAGNVQWSIRDQGPGIPAHEQGHLFEAFFHGCRNRDGTGAFGLGLAITHRIMRAHGGNAWADNVPGSGAVLHLSIGDRDVIPGSIHST